jgi:hypothetical protein
MKLSLTSGLVVDIWGRIPLAELCHWLAWCRSGWLFLEQPCCLKMALTFDSHTTSDIRTWIKWRYMGQACWICSPEDIVHVLSKNMNETHKASKHASWNDGIKLACQIHKFSDHDKQVDHEWPYMCQ